MLFHKLFRRAGPGELSALAIAGTIGLHMVSGIAVGSIAGYLLDQWLDTAPWGLLVLMILGIVAGFKNVYVDARRLVASQEGIPGAREKKPGDLAKPARAEKTDSASRQNHDGNSG